jgi:signal transduction histidine kinase
LPNGQDRFVEVIKTPLRNPDGAIIGTQSVFWDVTDRKMAEERALQAERLAAIGQTVAGVAHESRNALQQIQACSRMLEWELNGKPETKALLEDLEFAQERLRALFDNLRGYASARKLDSRLCNVRDVLQQAWKSLEHQRENRNVVLGEDSSTAKLQCVIDRYQFEQVFRNVFENALKACNDPVRLHVRFSDTFVNGQAALQVAIQDNGPGLAPELRQRVFEPFFTTSTRGTGLGLAIVKRIVEEHGGCNAFSDSSDLGAEIVIKVPRGGV